MKQIVVMEPLGVSGELLQSLAEPFKVQGYELVVHGTKETDQVKLLDRVREASIIILANQPLSGEIIRQCPNLEFISVAFTGVDHVDLDACREKGIVVSNAAGYSTKAVAELVFGLAISVMRNVLPCDGRTRTGGTKDGLPGFELHGKTFGVVGMGAIGVAVARIAKAFGCHVLAYNRSEKPELLAEGFAFADLDTVVRDSDILSLHVPLNDATRYLIDAKRIDSMKDTAILINTARGPVVDNEALAKALKAGKLRGAGIDVFEVEPPIPTDHPLCDAPRTVLTPHIAFASQEAFVTRAHIVTDNILAFLQGEPVNRVC
ncbi:MULTISPECIES: 2-hydroxyacid dehydrogenase [unclassified Veillonella]|uniref:2-hydroxyacid dehydrogenase n=1 Tax=unclassified Veillonella TaxID=2630086 RepID=UPI000F8C35BC|nr:MULTISPECIES: 2-hydroxyacid dehydrogenase [unclassified Veillonella]